VSPGWDVVPRVDPGPAPSSASRATVARQYWQVYAVDNVVDIRSCRKKNPHKPKAGEIDVWGLMVDSTFENNRQYESDGLMLNAVYDAPDPDTEGSATEVRAKYFVEVRGNTVDHEYAYDDPCSLSGIKLEYGSRAANQSEVVEGYGVNIVKNTIVNADGLRGGGIAIVSGWFSPTAPMFRSTLIQKNTIRDIQGEPIGAAEPDTKACDVRHDRIGINLAAGAWRTVLFGNAIGTVANPIVDEGTQTVQLP